MTKSGCFTYFLFSLELGPKIHHFSESRIRIGTKIARMYKTGDPKPGFIYRGIKFLFSDKIGG
jgi:hypothetical protein